MYKLLLVTDQEDKIALLQHQIDWPSLGCRAPQIVRSAEAGVELLNSSAVDAVGYSLKGDSTPLTRYLRYGRAKGAVCSRSISRARDTSWNSHSGSLVRK